MPYVYILRCNDQTLYVGWTVDVEKRLQKHNQGKGAKYTRGRTPVKLVYQETVVDGCIARQREYQLKQLTKKQKEQLIVSYRKKKV